MPLEHLDHPPNEASAPYMIPQLEGERLTIPGSRGVFRIVSPRSQAKSDADNTIAVFTSGSVLADAPGFHHHERAHDVFLVSKGTLQLWVGDQCRILGPGDFASVPPGVVHNPRMLGPHTELWGLIAPAEWLDFFRTVGDPFAGVLFPENDARRTLEHIIPRIKAAGRDFDVHFHPDFKGAEVGEWTAKDEALPAGEEAYFLKANMGPRFMLGGVLCRPFAMAEQTRGRFAMASIEGSARLGDGALGGWMQFATNHCFAVMEGKVEVVCCDDRASEVLTEGESVWLPAGTAFSIRFKSNFCRVWTFANGTGIEALMVRSGSSYGGIVLPDDAPTWTTDGVQAVAKQIGLSYCAS